MITRRNDNWKETHLMIANATQRSLRAARRFVNAGEARAIPWRN